MEYIPKFFHRSALMREHRLIGFSPEVKEPEPTLPSPDSEPTREASEAAAEAIFGMDEDEMDAEKQRAKLREIDDKVHDDVREKASIVVKNEAALAKLIEDLVAAHKDAYKGLKSERQVQSDIAWSVIYNVKNFPMRVNPKEKGTKKYTMDRIEPEASFDENGKIEFIGEVQLIEDTAENRRAQALHAVKFFEANLDDAWENGQKDQRGVDLGHVMRRITFPISSFRLLNQRQQLAAASKAMESFKEKHPKVFEISSALGVMEYKPELNLDRGGRYTIPANNGSIMAGRITPDMSVFEEEKK
jgi:hypothetical protein